MRRILLAALATLFAFVVVGPAGAQRDPFQPPPGAEEPGSAAEQPPEGAEPQPAVERPATGPGVANTGFDGSPWLAVGYVLIAIGAGLVVAGRLSRSRSR